MDGKIVDTILRILELDEFYGVSKNVDIAKGKYEFNTSFSKSWKQHKRDKAWRKRSI